MTDSDDEIVRAGSRRVVGRAALRRASRIVRQWQDDERDKRLLARYLIAALLLVALAVFIAVRIFY